jgi:hypothetical protein
MPQESRQRAQSNISNTSDRRGPISTPRHHRNPPNSLPQPEIPTVTSPPSSSLTPLGLSNLGSPYPQLSPGGAGAARASSPRGRAHTVADPQIPQRQLNYAQGPAMHQYIPPPPPQPSNTPAGHIALPPPPPRPTGYGNLGGIQIPPPPHSNNWGPPRQQYHQQGGGYDPGQYRNYAHNLPPPPGPPPQQIQHEREGPLTSATSPGASHLGLGLAYLHCTPQEGTPNPTTGTITTLPTPMPRRRASPAAFSRAYRACSMARTTASTTSPRRPTVAITSTSPPREPSNMTRQDRPQRPCRIPWFRIRAASSTVPRATARPRSPPTIPQCSGLPSASNTGWRATTSRATGKKHSEHWAWRGQNSWTSGVVMEARAT